jgi:predicted nucleic acid-binding protein
MKYLLDTCVLSELIKPHPNVLVTEWMSSVEESQLFISVVTIGELRKGIDQLVPGKRRQKLNQWFQEILDWSEGRTLYFDTASAKTWGSLLVQFESAGRSIPIIDSMIIAVAMAHECSVVTRNTHDFIGTHLSVINPWE